jgi:hypothetical protein
MLLDSDAQENRRDRRPGIDRGFGAVVDGNPSGFPPLLT